jgi:microcystin-dependent protein
MATVTGLTAARMLEIEASSVVDANIVGGHLILITHDGTEIDAGSVAGPAGPQGPAGPSVNGIPGEIKLWPSIILPDAVTYGKWVWANGDIFDIATYPISAANIDDSWNTAMGLANPGAGKFRVPDLRGLVPAGLDAMPVGAARASRLTRAEALSIALKTGEEKHRLLVAEMALHSHRADNGNLSGGVTGNDSPDHQHSGSTGGESNDHTHGVPMNYNRVSTGAGGGGTNYMTGLTGASAGTVSFSSQTGGRSAGHTHGFTTGFASARHAHGINPNGSDTPHETVQPTIMVPYIVCLGG